MRSNTAQYVGSVPISSTTLGASYTIAAPILQRFNAVVPHGERSRVMEGRMKQALAAREVELEQIAQVYMTDPVSAECREDEKLTVGCHLQRRSGKPLTRLDHGSRARSYFSGQSWACTGQ